MLQSLSGDHGVPQAKQEPGKLRERHPEREHQDHLLVSETNINLAELVIKCLGMLSNEYLNRCNAVLNRVCCALRMKRM